MHPFECICHVLYSLADVLQGSGHSLSVSTPDTIDHNGNVLQHRYLQWLCLTFPQFNCCLKVNLKVFNLQLKHN